MAGTSRANLDSQRVDKQQVQLPGAQDTQTLLRVRRSQQCSSNPEAQQHEQQKPATRPVEATVGMVSLPDDTPTVDAQVTAPHQTLTVADAIAGIRAKTPPSLA
ncbi:hypothetical protein AK812_SmicGene23796 [Symbiodinium microadriaticum]|uniref:Uncharacterized protein n=1 Tax=Symbiodinium microadriaticum TaxID=2951 RepID=A0A1Q9DGJ9_SYMMI|nr:hypothetical protein AK812_SmicGene23796 [Symbiodinium microadriaticum]